MVISLMIMEQLMLNRQKQKDRQSMDVVDDGKEAVTHFNVIEHFNDYTLIECQLETGRTHQIRVHMKYIGFHLLEIQIWS